MPAMPDTLNIPNKAPTLYVIFTAEINPTTVEKLTAIMVQAAKKRVRKCIWLSLLQEDKCKQESHCTTLCYRCRSKLTVHNIGSVDSIGNVIFLAGEDRYAAENATFMFHGVGFDVKGPIRIEEQYARDRLESSYGLSDQKRMGQIITSRSCVKNDEIAKLFRGLKRPSTLARALKTTGLSKTSGTSTRYRLAIP